MSEFRRRLLMMKGQPRQYTVRLVPTSWESDTEYMSVSNFSNIGNVDNTANYASVSCSQKNTTSYRFSLNGFPTDTIPQNAVIDSFVIKIRVKESNLSSGNNYKPCLLTDLNTAISGSSNVTGSSGTNYVTTTSQIITFPDCTTWSVITNAGDDFGIFLPYKLSSSGTTGYYYIYGAEIQVTYTV